MCVCVRTCMRVCVCMWCACVKVIKMGDACKCKCSYKVCGDGFCNTLFVQR